MFFSGSTEEYWCRQDAAQAIALVESFSLFSSTVYMFFVLDFQEELKVSSLNHKIICDKKV
jgi:hypothetical protein